MFRTKKGGERSKQKTTGLFIKPHSVSLAFAVTDYKLQGKSLDVLILSLAPRKFEPPFYLHSLYVLLSRVRTRAGLRVLCVPPDWDHLTKLHHEPALEIWEGAYDNGRFSPTKASLVASAVAARLREIAKAEKAKREAKKKAEKGQRKATQRRCKAAASAGAAAKSTNAASTQPRCESVSQKRARIEAESKWRSEVAAEAKAKRGAKRQKRGLLRAFSPGAPSPKVRRCVPSSPHEAAPPRQRQRRTYTSGSEALGAALQNVVWSRFSCSFDASAMVMLLAHRAVSDLTGRPLGTGYFPPPQPCLGTPPQGEIPEPAQIGDALKRWVAAADALAHCTSVDLQLRGLGILNALRDQLRKEVRRAELLLPIGSSRRRSFRNEAQVAAQLRRDASRTGNAQANLRSMLRAFSAEDFARHDWMGGGSTATRRCSDCGHQCIPSGIVDRRLHELTSDDLRAAHGDPLLAFASRHIEPRLVGSEVNPCPGCGSVALYQDGWFSDKCIQPDAPPLLGLFWHTDPYAATRAADACEGEMMPTIDTAGEPLPTEAAFPTDRLDAASFSTSFGEVTFRLIALVYYSGNHYITVGRTAVEDVGGQLRIRVLDAAQWVCWDANHNHGRGCVLDGPPKPNGSLWCEGQQVWSQYRAETAIYARTSSSPAPTAVAAAAVVDPTPTAAAAAAVATAVATAAPAADPQAFGSHCVDRSLLRLSHGKLFCDAEFTFAQLQAHLTAAGQSLSDAAVRERLEELERGGHIESDDTSFWLA